MPRIRMIILSLLAVFAVSAVASASAAAASLEWEVCEELAGAGTEPPLKFDNHKCNSEAKPLAERKWEWKLLAAGVTRNVLSSGGEFKLIAVGKTITCAKVLDSGTITGGKPGTDLVTDIIFEECKTSQTGCGVHTTGQPIGIILVANIPTKLETRKNAKGVEVTVDNFEQNPTSKEFVTLKFEAEAGKSCSQFPETKVKGTIAAEAGPEPGELNFPNPRFEKDTLNAFAEEVTLVGKDTQEVMGGSELFGEGWAVRAS
jgi:hypothetical protein